MAETERYLANPPKRLSLNKKAERSFPAFEFAGERFQTIERRSHRCQICRRKKCKTFLFLRLIRRPLKSRPALQALQGAFGMIPNVAGTMATSPVLVDSLVALFGKVHGGSFTEAQIQTLLLTNAVTNGCSWAVAFHTGMALKEGLDQADVQAIRERRVPKDARSAALSTFARTLIEKRGRVDDPTSMHWWRPGSARSTRWK